MHCMLGISRQDAFSSIMKLPAVVHTKDHHQQTTAGFKHHLLDNVLCMLRLDSLKDDC